MAPNLDDLLTDGRLARLFSQDGRPCALQLWILQIKSENQIENRPIYGRLLPYTYASDSWSATDDDHFTDIGPAQAQLVRLNLFLKSNRCAHLLRSLSAGQTLSVISKDLELDFSAKLKSRFGDTALAADALAYRPVAYLLNRDAHDPRTPSSPHGGAGAFSAAIMQTDKGDLFRLGQTYDVALARSLVPQLNEDTGLDFGGTDVARFGDLELLVFPALDDYERRLLRIEWDRDPLALVVRFDPMQLPYFTGFQFRLCIKNDGQVVDVRLAAAVRGENGVFECHFQLSDQLRARTDSADLEVFGLRGEASSDGVLCCRWGGFYIREVHIQGQVEGHASNPVKFDWLEKATRPSMRARVKAATTINRGAPAFASRVGGREADPWVPANRDLIALFARLHPPTSEGRFFQRWRQGDGGGRLQFVEWFKALLANYKQHQIIIFDPYFEDVGLNLLSLHAAQGADYIVFTSLPKTKAVDEASTRETEPPAPGRIDNLVTVCELNRHLLSRFKLRIFGLKDGRLHDRYILALATDGLPSAGFHLSNSFQKAAENYPLLITPIPADVLLEVERYSAALVREAEEAHVQDATSNPALQVLFNSKAAAIAPRTYEPLRFLDKAYAGDVLSVWADRPELEGLSGESLTARMTQLGLVTENRLSLPQTAGLHNGLQLFSDESVDFDQAWEMLGELIAHSPGEEQGFPELESEHRFLDFLAVFLETAFQRGLDGADKEVAVLETGFFHESLETLLHSSYRPDILFRATKYKALSWAEYFCVKLLWSYAPAALLTIAEAQMVDVPLEPQAADAVRLSLLSQIVSEISLAVQFGVGEAQLDRLLRSRHALPRWLGLNALARRLEDPESLSAALEVVATFSPADQVQTLGWMVHRAAKQPKTAEIYAGLVAALHDALPSRVSKAELGRLVHSMRGHMQRLAWAEPWLFQDVVFPLLQTSRADFDDACEIWAREVAIMIEPPVIAPHAPGIRASTQTTSRFFAGAREGQTTNVAAFLYACSSSARRQASMTAMNAMLRRQQRIVRQPLASTSNWMQWNGALEVSLWLLSFTRWVQVYLRENGTTDDELKRLSESAGELAALRSMDEWRSLGPGEQGALAAFLERAEALLTGGVVP